MSRTYDIHLSQIGLIGKYIAALDVDPTALLQQQVRLQDEIASLRGIAEVEAIKVKDLEAERDRILPPLKAEREEAERAVDRLLMRYAPDIVEDKKGFAASYYDPSSMSFDPKNCEVWQRFDKARSVVIKATSRYQYIDKSQLRAATSNLQRAVAEADGITAQLATLRRNVHATHANLPTGVADAPETLLRHLNEMKWGWRCGDEPDLGSNALIAAYIRGDLPLACDCEGGYVSDQITYEGLTITILMDDKVRHPHCAAREQFDPKWIDGCVPLKHEKHRLYSLSSWAKSPLPETTQLVAIGRIPPSTEGLYGWLMVGDPGTSKTTYAAAAIVDWLTFRASESGGGSRWGDSTSERLNYWRIKAPKWTRDMEAYETRDFGDEVVAVEVTPSMVERATSRTGLPPILWLEELDKFVPTENRLRNLYTLIDMVYECNGTIVSTANKSLPALRKLLGGPIYRRLTGENDDPDCYIVYDLFAAASKPAKKAVT